MTDTTKPSNPAAELRERLMREAEAKRLAEEAANKAVEPVRQPGGLKFKTPASAPVAEPPRQTGGLKFKTPPPVVAPPAPEPQRQAGGLKFKTPDPVVPIIAMQPQPVAPRQGQPLSMNGQEAAVEARLGMKIKTPEEARFDRMLAQASQIDPAIGGSVGFRVKLEKLLTLRGIDIVNWGSKALEVNRAITETLSSITRDLTMLEANRWIDEAKIESTKPEPTGFFEKMKKRATPAFYEAKLAQIRDQLQPLAKSIDDNLKSMTTLPESFAQEVLALQVVLANTTEAGEMQIMDTRFRNLIQVQQAILQTKGMLDSLKVTMVNTIQQIDTLLTSVIPNWKLAEAQRVRP